MEAFAARPRRVVGRSEQRAVCPKAKRPEVVDDSGHMARVRNQQTLDERHARDSNRSPARPQKPRRLPR